MPTNNAFLPETIIPDIDTLKTVLTDFAASLPAADWQSYTEKDNRGWTVQQTIAHLAITTRRFNEMVELALAGKPMFQQNDIGRDGLPETNQSGIEELISLSPEQLLQTFIDELERTQEQCRTVRPSRYNLEIPFPFYNRGGTVSEFWAWHLCHIGIVHASQISRFTTKKPLWQEFPQDMQSRNISRFLSQLSHVYWPERGGKLNGAINFIIGDEAWHVFLASDGGSFGEGKHSKSLLTLKCRDYDTFCRLFTMDLKPFPAVLSGRVWATGNIFLAFRLAELFRPT